MSKTPNIRLYQDEQGYHLKQVK